MVGWDGGLNKEPSGFLNLRNVLMPQGMVEEKPVLEIDGKTPVRYKPTPGQTYLVCLVRGGKPVEAVAGTDGVLYPASEGVPLDALPADLKPLGY